MIVPAIPTLYIDHSLISHEPSWGPLQDVLAAKKLWLALSLWNLVEIGSASDAVQREKRLAFLEQFDPFWIVERVNVQRQEVRAFLWAECFGAAPEPFVSHTPHLSVVDSYHAGPQTRIGLTARQWIAGVDFDRLDHLKDKAPNALKILQAIDPKTFKARQHEIFRPWIRGLIPEIGPDGRALTTARREELLDHCQKNQDHFFAACRSLAVEDALTAARVANPARNPQRSDGIDLMHTVIALSYCDHFLVRDGFIAACAGHAARVVKVPLATVHRTAEALKAAFP